MARLALESGEWSRRLSGVLCVQLSTNACKIGIYSPQEESGELHPAIFFPTKSPFQTPGTVRPELSATVSGVSGLPTPHLFRAYVRPGALPLHASAQNKRLLLRPLVPRSIAVQTPGVEYDSSNQEEVCPPRSYARRPSIASGVIIRIRRSRARPSKASPSRARSKTCALSCCREHLTAPAAPQSPPTASGTESGPRSANAAR